MCYFALMYISLDDSLRIAGSYTRFSRWTNLFKLWFSWVYSRFSRGNWVLGKPASMSIEPTTACNLGCPHCPSGLKSFSRPTGKMKAGDFHRYIDSIAGHTGYLTLYFQGEPYINKEFTDMLASASAQNIYTSTSTNAHFLTPENAEKTVLHGLKRMIISIDGTSQESYAKYRLGGQLDAVLAGTKNILAARKKLGKNYPRVVWQFIVFRHNESEIPELRRLARAYGVDKLVIKTAQIYDFANAENWLPENKDLSRYEKRGEEVRLKNRMHNRCWRMWSGCVITWDGGVVPCCFDKDATHRLGSLQEKSFDEIWHGPAYREFRAALRKGRSNIEICSNCTEGTKVWL